jgi:hydroxyethylthiazole kinase-like uncharacterized protein yjeF
MANAIYLTREIRRIEEAAGEVVPPLMQRAASAAADLAVKLIGDRGKDVLVLAGPGNNGGDARIVAEILKSRFFRVTLASADAQPPAGTRWDLVVDGLFGIGLSRPVEGVYAQLVELANRQQCPRLALDIPSGIESDTGRVLGQALRATHTITFIALKPGLLTLDGPDHCGEISVADLGLDTARLVEPSGWRNGPGLLHGLLKPRPRNFHKGMAGSVAVIGGAAGMTGAALLAARAALKLGAGRVYAGMLDPDAPRVDHLCPELMLRSPDDTLGLDLDAIVVGPGLGRSEHADALVGAVLATEAPCVLDADALNLIAENDDLRAACARRKSDTLATPHPAEAARLLGIDTAEVQRDRLAEAQRLSGELNAHVVLKGCGSVLVARDGHWFINSSGNAGMASAGMGDVLSGILGALLAQKFTGEAALIAGVHLHGAAADLLAREGTGPVGLTAGETIDAARRVWNGWIAAGGVQPQR